MDFAEGGVVSSEPDIIVHARTLWTHRTRIFRLVLAALVITALVALLIPNTYEAEVQLMPPDTESLSGGLSAMGLDPNDVGLGGYSISSRIGKALGGANAGPLLLAILSSPSVEDRM